MLLTLPVTAECVIAAVPAMAANPEDIELEDGEEMDEEGEADGGEAAANMQLEEKAVPVCCPELGHHPKASVQLLGLSMQL